MTLGLMAKDCEIRVDYDKLRADRVRKTNEQMEKDFEATSHRQNFSQPGLRRWIFLRWLDLRWKTHN